jgi:hypothetical protein
MYRTEEDEHKEERKRGKEDEHKGDKELDISRYHLLSQSAEATYESL